MIARLICRLFGHKRGKFLHMDLQAAIRTNTAPIRTIECPRCKATWPRKDSKAKAAA